MKKLRFLLAALLTLMCANVWAQKDWSTEAVPLDEVLKGGEYYIYSPKYKMFLGRGHDWGTRATLDYQGLTWVVETLGEGIYGLRNTSRDGHAKGYMYIDGANSDNIVYVDHGDYNPISAKWQIVPVEGLTYTYTIQSSNGYYIRRSDNETAISKSTLITDDADRFYWCFIPKSTREDLTGASLSNPVDVTYYIYDQNMDTHQDQAVDPNRGHWSAKTNDGYNAPNWNGGLGVNTCAEVWNSPFNVSQTLTGIPNGIYRLKAQGFYRIGKDGNAGDNNAEQAAKYYGTDNEHINAFFYANDEKEPFPSIFDNDCHDSNKGNDYVSGSQIYTIGETTYYIPSGMNHASKWFSDGAYETSLVVEVTNGTLTIGAKNDVNNDAQWAIFDNFRLEYLGEKAEPALEGFLYTVVDEQKKFLTRGADWNTRAILGDFGVPVKVTPPTSDGKTKIKFLDSQLFFYSDGQGALYTNANYDFRYYRTQFIITGNEADGYELQSDNRNYKGTIGVHDGYKLSHETTPLKWHFMSKADYETLIVSRNLAYRSAGYSVEELNKIPTTEVKSKDDTQTKDGREFFNVTPFTNIEQDRLNTWSFTSLEKGLYKVNVKAFYRAGDIEHFRLQAAAGYDEHLALLRANNDYVQISSILSSKNTDKSHGGSDVKYNNTTYYVPQSTGDAEKYFGLGYYDNVLYTNVGDDGKLDISIVCDGFIGAQWLMFRDLVISRVETDKFLVDINEHGASTFSSTRSYQVPKGLEAWYATSCDASSVSMTKIADGKIPANTGVVLRGAQGQYTLTLVNDASDIDGTNLLVAVPEKVNGLAAQVGDNTNYILYNGAFCTWDNTATVNVAAGKAYLSVPAASSNAKNYVLDWGEADGIETVAQPVNGSSEKVFNLAGQAVGNDYKGIVIMNGKKIYQR